MIKKLNKSKLNYSIIIGRKVIIYCTSVTYREATAGPKPIPVPTNNRPRSIPSKFFVIALQADM